MRYFKEIEFREKNNFHKKFFRFDKKIIENKNWALLKPSSKSIYPSIVYHRNRRSGESFPGQETISITSGRDLKTVREGIKGLAGFPGIEAQPYVTRRGRTSTRFKITETPNEKGRAFHFHNIIIDCGNWRCLTPAAQALYPVMRHFCFFDFEMYTELFPDYFNRIHKEPYHPDYRPDHFYSFDDTYATREYEFCEAEKQILMEYSGISKSSLYNALKNLETYELIKPLDSGLFTGWWVYFKPVRICIARELNDEIIKKLKTK